MSRQNPESCLGHGNFPQRMGSVLLLGLLAAGCSGKGEVSGKVSYRGQPLVGGVVTFFHPTKGAFNSRIYKDGSYVIPDIPAGKVKVAVKSLPPSGRSANPMAQMLKQESAKKGKTFSAEDRAKMSPEMKAALENSSAPKSPQEVKIPANYADPEKSGLEYTVIGGKQTRDLELK
jgi:hypothetical protein